MEGEEAETQTAESLLSEAETQIAAGETSEAAQSLTAANEEIISAIETLSEETAPQLTEAQTAELNRIGAAEARILLLEEALLNRQTAEATEETAAEQLSASEAVEVAEVLETPQEMKARLKGRWRWL